jgi:diadenosine tetraphosphate (Ap4A) HIT family hydrolase
MNDTIRKFGYPETLIAEYHNWVVLLRPDQPTLGSLVLAAKSDATAFSALPADAFAELAQVTAAIETALTKAIRYDRINYLMLMMVDPHVHFHIIPRYQGERVWDATSFTDNGWPKIPDLGHYVSLTAELRDSLKGELQRIWSP